MSIDQVTTLPTPATPATLLAYHSDPEIKAKYLRRVQAHREADQLVQGYGYWTDGKGCAVGCTIHGSSHAAYEAELGIPTALAWLEDRIFEGLPVAEARTWPERFLQAPRVGADLSQVPYQMVAWLLTEQIPATKNVEVEALRAELLELFKPLEQGLPLDRAAFRALYPKASTIRREAWAAYHRAVAERRRAAAAEAAVAEAAAAAAAEAAAEAAEAAAAEAPWGPARRQAYIRQSEKLLELMAAA